MEGMFEYFNTFDLQNRKIITILLKNCNIIAKIAISLQRLQYHCKNYNIIAKITIWLQKLQYYGKNYNIIAKIIAKIAILLQ